MLIEDQKKLFLKLYNVSRETFNKLENYHEMIISSQKKINLIGKGTVDKIWIRHFADSAKILPIIAKFSEGLELNKTNICDVGSGAGFPGVIISMLLKEIGIKSNISLIEANKKKCLFLESVKKQLNLDLKVINHRAENLHEKQDIVLARALSPLKKIFRTIKNLVGKDTKIILHKGAAWQDEIKELKNKWKFEFNIVKNNKLIDDSGGIAIVITNLHKKL